MQILQVSQSEDREAWLESRKGIITGSKVKSVKPLSRGEDRTATGFWELLAEQISVEKDGEDDRERGLRLENEALEKTAQLYELNLNLDPGMWVSDIDPSIAVSPDSAEQAEVITYAAEAKCLKAANHLKFLYKDKMARKQPAYVAFNSVPPEFKEQVIQYFAVNENLETVYVTLYNDRIVFDHLTHWVIVVKRSEVEQLITMQIVMEQEILSQLEKVRGELINE